jgi:hypothetical protein
MNRIEHRISLAADRLERAAVKARKTLASYILAPEGSPQQARLEAACERIDRRVGELRHRLANMLWAHRVYLTDAGRRTRYDADCGHLIEVVAIGNRTLLRIADTISGETADADAVVILPERLRFLEVTSS